MVNPAVSLPDEAAAEARLRDALADADRALAGAQPALRHLLATDRDELLSDRTIAQVGAMLHDLARQLADDDGNREALAAALAEALGGHAALLAHVHALALEAQVADRLAERLSLDPVIPPLLEALMASPEPDAANQLVAAQARFGQAQRRGELPLGELPGDLLHAALIVMRACASSDQPQVRADHDPSRNRLELLGRAVTTDAFDLEHAGVALFASALALGAGLDRDSAVLSLTESQAPRLVLALTACGLGRAAIERNFLALHPDAALPEAWVGLSPDRAAALLGEF
ncbi:MAG TPA: hypothetical protein VM055_01110 [Novosphingobium sp.]|nr:hypothetical protein [Novosphingobium sp.]